MDAHQMMTTLLTLVAFLGGCVMHSFRAQLKDNRNDIKETSDRVHAVEVLVASKYVTREELAAHTETVLKNLIQFRVTLGHACCINEEKMTLARIK